MLNKEEQEKIIKTYDKFNPTSFRNLGDELNPQVIMRCLYSEFNDEDFMCPYCGGTKFKKKENHPNIHYRCVNGCFDLAMRVKGFIEIGSFTPLLYCPICGSTAITTGARGITWSLGLIGANKTQNRCGSCGHTWYPK